MEVLTLEDAVDGVAEVGVVDLVVAVAVLVDQVEDVELFQVQVQKNQRGAELRS